jgi:hypothetical protein
MLLILCRVQRFWLPPLLNPPEPLPGHQPLPKLETSHTFFHITVKDNACPIMGFQTHTFGVKVSATGSVTGTGKLMSNNSGISVFPNPFNKEVKFKLNQSATFPLQRNRNF